MPEEPKTTSPPNGPRKMRRLLGLLGLLAATLLAGSAWAYYIGRRDPTVYALALSAVALLAMLLSGRFLKRSRERQSPASWAKVLRDERTEIERERRLGGEGPAEALSSYVGLALSGGGIRSATFNLGLLQALAELRLLSRIDYLSTVSGGGYIGSWLTQWVRNAQPKEAGDSLFAGAPNAEGPDVRVAAMLYVASAGGELGATDREVIKSACGGKSGTAGDWPNQPDPELREEWLARTAAAQDSRGERLDPHARAGIAACARRVVNAHRVHLEESSKELLEKKMAALAEVEQALQLRGIDKIQHALADEASVATPEPRPVSHLREFSNYLTPQVGLLTADTWTTVATYVRNFAINLVLITATVSFALLLPRVIHRLGAWIDENFEQYRNHWSQAGAWVAENWSLGLAGLAAMLAVFGIAESLREAALDKDLGQNRGRSQGDIQKFIVLPLGFAALCTAHWLGSGTGQHLDWKQWAVLTATAYALPWLLFGWWSAFIGGDEESKAKDHWTLANAVLALSGLAVGAAGGLAIYKLKEAWMAGALGPWGLLTVGPPLIMVTFTMSAVLLIGLAGRHLDDYLREWLARVGAWVSIYSLGWLGLMSLATYGPVLLAAAESGGRWLLASGWLAASIGGVLAGNARQQGAKSKWHGPAVRFAPWVFILGLVLSLTWALDAGLSRQSEDTRKAWSAFHEAARTQEVSEVLDYQRDGSRLRLERSEKPSAGWFKQLRQEHEKLLNLQIGISRTQSGERVLDRGPWIVLLSWLLGLVLIAGLFGWRVDINEFSMHNYYRNRLVRAYLGASNPNRPTKTQPFTGMARSDDTPLGADWALRPYHLVNTAINLVGGNRLAWQQRKAASYVLSPLYCGFELPPSESTYDREAAFRKTTSLEDLTLGTALAISGAAASPNMGFRSSPALTLLLTVFNVRLGWWLGNPKGPAWYRLTPKFALAPLLSELFGLTSLDSKYVYLSDGGHFENLGIYELVRRRCRFIIASDVAADPELAFEDLGNAVRKCRSDFGAQIDIDIGPLAPNAAGVSSQHCVVGKITYAAETDGGLKDRGWLLYIKSSLTGDEPEDVLQYKKANDAFPHQSTADQFFDEPQFESYRELGRHVGHRVFESASGDLDRIKNWYSLFDDLKQRWHRSSASVERSFSKHGQALDRLFERLGSDRNLEFLDSQIYSELGSALSRPTAVASLPTKRRERRAGFYFCSSLIQLMENVYLDLDLDDDQEHPDNRGWLRLFERWAQVPMVIATWAVTADSYGSRFQSFCERRLQLPLSQVAIGPPLEIERLGRIRRDVLAKRETIAKDETISWHELVAEAPGLSFPIGKVVLWSSETTKASLLLYYEIDYHLRGTGLAERGLRALKEHLNGELQLVPSDDRLPSISADVWRAFEHLYHGAVSGWHDR